MVISPPYLKSQAIPRPYTGCFLLCCDLAVLTISFGRFKLIYGAILLIFLAIMISTNDGISFLHPDTLLACIHVRTLSDFALSVYLTRSVAMMGRCRMLETNQKCKEERRKGRRRPPVDLGYKITTLG